VWWLAWRDNVHCLCAARHAAFKDHISLGCIYTPSTSKTCVGGRRHAAHTAHYHHHDHQPEFVLNPPVVWRLAAFVVN
jgi:hypothetical protein